MISPVHLKDNTFTPLQKLFYHFLHFKNINLPIHAFKQNHPHAFSRFISTHYSKFVFHALFKIHFPCIIQNSFSLHYSKLVFDALFKIPFSFSHALCGENGSSRQEECHNFVKLLALEGRDTLISCGTYAHSPMCTWRNVRLCGCGGVVIVCGDGGV